MVTVARGGGVILLGDGTEVKVNHQADRGRERRRTVPDGRRDRFGRPARTSTTGSPASTPKPAPSRPPVSLRTKGRPRPCSSGAYRASGRRHERLMRALPPVLVIDEGSDVCAWLDACAMDIGSRKPGTQAFIDRLFDWGLVCTLRTWFDHQGGGAGLVQGFTDPIAGPALEASTPTREPLDRGRPRR